MTRQIDFADPAIITSLTVDLVKRLSPLVSNEVAHRNATQAQLEPVLSRISGLEARQEVLKTEISSLREQGINRITADKPNAAISVKINSREAELKETEGWLSKLRPQAETMAAELKAADSNLLEALRVQIRPFHAAKEQEMNDLLEEASKLKHSFFKAAALAMDEIGGRPLFSRSVAISTAFRLKISWARSAFRSPGR